MNAAAKSIRVVLADDHPLVRAGIRAELEKLAAVQVVGEAGNGREALALVRARHPDAAFIDISMPELNGLEVLARITTESPGVRVVILSMHENEEYVWRALRAGAAGYLRKKAATAELGTALQRVLQGEIYLCREIAARLAKKFHPKGLAAAKTPAEKLTARQRVILCLIAQGRNAREIAGILKLNHKTVEYHRMKLMQTLNLHDIPALVRFAVQLGLVGPEI